MNSLKEMDPKTVRIGAAVLVVIVGVILYFALSGGSDNSTTGPNGPGPCAPLNGGKAVGLTANELVKEAPTFPHPAYWIGPKSDVKQYELTGTDQCQIYVRYLPSSGKPGDQLPYLTVGTYQFPDALNGLKQSLQEGNAKSLKKFDGYSVLQGTGNNAYVVFDLQPDLQIEVFSPKKGEAYNIAKSGDLQQIG